LCPSLHVVATAVWLTQVPLPCWLAAQGRRARQSCLVVLRCVSAVCSAPMLLGGGGAGIVFTLIKRANCRSPLCTYVLSIRLRSRAEDGTRARASPSVVMFRYVVPIVLPLFCVMRHASIVNTCLIVVRKWQQRREKKTNDGCQIKEWVFSHQICSSAAKTNLRGGNWRREW
jgi:hypothetical protein